MKQTSRMLIGLVAGLVIGLSLSIGTNPAVVKIVSGIEVVGILWISVLKMTVIPLVLSLLITGIASARDSANVGRIAGKALLTFLILYVLAAAATMLISPLILMPVKISPETVSSLNQSLSESVGSPVPIPSFRDQLIGIIPTNPFKAATDGDMLPLVIFSILFGLAITRISQELHQLILRLFQGIADTMLVIVKWTLVVAPIGIFAIVLPLAMRLGFSIVGVLAYYVVILSALCILFTIALYPIAMLLGRVRFGQFARAIGPAQSVALGTQSSLASLPSMIEATEVRLRLSDQATRVVLPLAVSVFRFSTPIWLVVASFFAARMYGISLSATQIATIGIMSIVMSIGGVGLPSGASYFAPITPVFLSVGLPVEAIPILFAVDTIPDMVETASNVTADLTVATIVDSRIEGVAEPGVVHRGRSL